MENPDLDATRGGAARVGFTNGRTSNGSTPSEALVAFTLLLFLSNACAAAHFDDDFTGATLRIDYYHMGTASQEHFGLDRVRVEGPWPGSRTQLIDATNLGPFLVEVVDDPSNRLLYSRGFANIFGEWQDTAEADNEIWRSFPEAVRIPEPRRPFRLRISKRDEQGSFREVWVTKIDPQSRFVDRAPVPRQNVWSLFESGNPSVKVDLLVLGDGYTEKERDTFHADVKRLMGAFFEVEPYASHKSDFNVRAIDVASEVSGITKPRGGVFRNTPLHARYNSLDSERYILTMNDRAWRDIAAAAPYDVVLILVNDRKYGGGGIFNLYATASARCEFAPYLVIHEFGHHFAGLGDEYFTSETAYAESDGPPREPWAPNVTAQTDRTKLKWKDLVSLSTPIPTPWNKESYETKSREFQKKRKALRLAGADEGALEALFRQERELFTRTLGEGEHASKVGAFEGAMYSSKGLYRPAADCLMFTRDEVGFCPVCRRGIEAVIRLHTR